MQPFHGNSSTRLQHSSIHSVTSVAPAPFYLSYSHILWDSVLRQGLEDMMWIRDGHLRKERATQDWDREASSAIRALQSLSPPSGLWVNMALSRAVLGPTEPWEGHDLRREALCHWTAGSSLCSLNGTRWHVSPPATLQDGLFACGCICAPMCRGAPGGQGPGAGSSSTASTSLHPSGQSILLSDLILNMMIEKAPRISFIFQEERAGAQSDHRTWPKSHSQRGPEWDPV